VRLTDANGKVTEFVAKGVNLDELKTREMRTMDCVDCHNRPSHRSPPRRDRGRRGPAARRDPGQPALRAPRGRHGAEAGFPTRESAEQAIKGHLEEFYAKNYPDLVKANDGRIAQAIAGTQRVYGTNVFRR